MPQWQGNDRVSGPFGIRKCKPARFYDIITASLCLFHFTLSRLENVAERMAQAEGKKMTNTNFNFGLILTLVVVSLSVVSCALVATASAETSPGLSKKELKTLLATAKTPSDHQQLAAYYRDKAQHLRAKAQEFSAQAEYLATQPATIESKQGISCNCASHYRYFAQQYAQEAQDADVLAAHHNQLAQDSSSAAPQK